MKEFTCIICPRGCHLMVDEDNNVSGNTCPKGKEYALNEITHPVRTITSSIRVRNRPYTLVSVKTSKPVPKELIFKVMKQINNLSVDAPTKIGDVVVKNILNLNVDILISKNIY